MKQPPRISILFPYTTLFRSERARHLPGAELVGERVPPARPALRGAEPDQGLGDRPRRDGSHSARSPRRSEEHTSELQSRFDIVCRLLLEKKNPSPTTTPLLQ